VYVLLAHGPKGETSWQLTTSRGVKFPKELRQEKSSNPCKTVYQNELEFFFTTNLRTKCKPI
jgi:hypothetical protein